MNKKDLVMRGDVLARKRKYRVYDETGCYCMEFAVSVKDINRISPVPHEMSAVEYHLIKRRMCKNCPVCPLNEAAINLFIDCKRFEREFPNEAVTIVEKWAREHPERSGE